MVNNLRLVLALVVAGERELAGPARAGVRAVVHHELVIVVGGVAGTLE